MIITKVKHPYAVGTTLHITPESAEDIAKIWLAQIEYHLYVFHPPNRYMPNTFIVWDMVNIDKFETFIRK